jgi:hypothetical protein
MPAAIDGQLQDVRTDLLRDRFFDLTDRAATTAEVGLHALVVEGIEVIEPQRIEGARIARSTADLHAATLTATNQDGTAVSGELGHAPEGGEGRNTPLRIDSKGTGGEEVDGSALRVDLKDRVGIDWILQVDAQAALDEREEVGVLVAVRDVGEAAQLEAGRLIQPDDGSIRQLDLDSATVRPRAIARLEWCIHPGR